MNLEVMMCINSNDFDGEPKDFNDSKMGFQRNLTVLMGNYKIYSRHYLISWTNFVPQGLFIH